MVKIKEINDDDYDDENHEEPSIPTSTITMPPPIIEKDEDLDKLIYTNIFRHLNRGEMDECIELVEADHSLILSTEDHYGMTVLHLASQKKMRRLVKRILEIVVSDELLSTRFDINKVDLNGNTALHYSCTSSINDITQQQQHQGSIQPLTTEISTNGTGYLYLKEKKSTRYSIVKLLIERGGSLTSIKNKMNLLAINLACKEIDFKVVELLIENADSISEINEPHSKVLDSLNFSLMFQSLQSSSNKFLTNHEKERNEKKKDTILSKIDQNFKSIKNGPTNLHFSLSNLKIIKDLTISLLLLNQTNDHQDLSYLERNHSLIKLIKLLLQKSCKPNSIDESTGKTAYHQFIDLFPKEGYELDEFLSIDDQLPVNNNYTVEDKRRLNEDFKNMISNLIYSITRLFYQCKYDFTKSSEKSIIESDKDIEETPLGQCSIYPTKKLILEQILNVIKNSGEDKIEIEKIINESINSRGQPSLFIACSYGNIEAVDLLLENGADPNIKDKFGSTMLHESLNFKHYEIAKKLILCGADVNEPMSVYPQSTPLHIAVTQCSFEMCHFLIEHGSLLNVYDNENHTPKDLISNLLENNNNDDNDNPNIEELKDLFEFHIQINLIQISSFVVFKGDYKLKVKEFIKSRERNELIVDKYMNQIFDGSDNEEKLNQLVESSSSIKIPLKEIKSSTKRIKIKSSKDQLFKYVNLYHQTFNHLLNIIQNRFKPNLVVNYNNNNNSNETIEQFEKNYIKSIILLPNVSITSDDQNLEFIRDDDEIVVEFLK